MQMTPKQAGRWFKQRPAILLRNLESAERQSLRFALRLAKSDSDTQHYSSATLARMGHPYATRNPNPPLDEGFINKQSGNFLSLWTTQGPNLFKNNELVSIIINNAKYAGYLQTGTRFMIARPIDILVQAQIDAQRFNFADSALRRSLRI